MNFIIHKSCGGINQELSQARQQLKRSLSELSCKEERNEPEICLGYDQLELIKHLLPRKADDSRKTAADGRLLTDTVVWTAKTGEP